MADRPRCSHCGRRVSRSGHSAVLHGNAERESFCNHRVACRRACTQASGTALLIDGASTEAHGTALLAADFVDWPRWARFLPQSARDEIARRFARVLSAAVERRTLERQAVRDE